MKKISEDSLAILLLTSNLLSMYSKDQSLKPFTLSQWNKLVLTMRDANYSSPEILFGKNSEELMKELFINDEMAERITKLLKYAGTMSIELERLAGLGIWVITRADKDYPIRIKQKLKTLAPSFFYGAGNIENLSHSLIGVVGSRNAEESSLQFTRNLANKLASENLGVVSGGAKGIDQTAQDQALLSGAKVVSILHSDLETLIKRKEVRNSILGGNFTLLSAVHPKAKFKGFNAMARNKYIYALSKATFVAASSTKGGTWEGAVENLQKGWVPLFVRMAPNVPDGNKLLLEKFKGNSLVKPYQESNNGKLVDIIKDALGTENNSIQKTNKVQSETDAYHLVLPVIKQLSKKDLNITELSEALNVNKEQATIWIDRAKMDLNNRNRSEHTKLNLNEDKEKIEQGTMF